MLTSIILTLTSEQDGVLPAHLGRAHYAETLKVLGQVDAALATEIHEINGPKPLTCSGLWGATGRSDNVTVRAGESYQVRVTGLTPPVSQALHRALFETPPPRWELHRHPFRLSEVICDANHHPWSGSTTYEELAAGQLLGSAQSTRHVTLKFASPTAFKSAGMTIPVPMPNLVFGSLVERWNSFSPVTLSPDMRRFGEEMVAISRYRLESRVLEQKNGALRIGAVGQATYTALGGDRYWLSVLQMLADFARYSGVGVQTATGMGQVRRLHAGA
jgi:CRISPR-associated endoribonuclease Cas6